MRENIPSSRTQALTKSMDMGIWIVGTLRDSYTKIKFSKK